MTSPQSSFSAIVSQAIWSIGGPSLCAAMDQDAFVGTTFVVSALVTVGFLNSTEGAGQAVDVVRFDSCFE